MSKYEAELRRFFGESVKNSPVDWLELHEDENEDLKDKKNYIEVWKRIG